MNLLCCGHDLTLLTFRYENSSELNQRGRASCEPFHVRSYPILETYDNHYFHMKSRHGYY